MWKIRQQKTTKTIRESCRSGLVFSFIVLALAMFTTPSVSHCDSFDFRSCFDTVASMDAKMINVQDVELGFLGNFSISARICSSYEGFGYGNQAVIFTFVDITDGSRSIQNVDLGLSACSSLDVKREGDHIITRDTSCDYFCSMSVTTTRHWKLASSGTALVAFKKTTVDFVAESARMLDEALRNENLEQAFVIIERLDDFSGGWIDYHGQYYSQFINQVHRQAQRLVNAGTDRLAADAIKKFMGSWLNLPVKEHVVGLRVELDPGDINTAQKVADLAHYLAAVQEHEPAIRFWMIAEFKLGQRADIQLAIADSLWALGQFDDAIQRYHRFIDLNDSGKIPTRVTRRISDLNIK